jgi:RNA polymerase sigma factor (TIGR02999 family)
MPDPSPEQITRLLDRWKAGDRDAENELFEALHVELRRLADRAMRPERRDHTLQPTELVAEAYLRLGPGAADWKNRTHFLAVAARAMRRVLIDYARARSSAKRGGGAPHVTFEPSAVPGGLEPVDLEALERALERLHALDERKARAVELRYFGGLSNAEIAALMEVSARTVKRDLQLGRAWLRRELQGDPGEDGGDGSPST